MIAKNIQTRQQQIQAKRRRNVQASNKPKQRPQLPKNTAAQIDPAPWLDQYDKTAYVIGGGPSLVKFNWNVLDGKFVVGINRAYEVLPHAQIIYFTDDDWYNQHKKGLSKHTGTKIKGSLSPNKLSDVNNICQFHLTGSNGLDMKKGCLKHGNNSTYAVLNMLCQWGFKTIYLLGVDLKWKNVKSGGNKGNRKTHWHSGHRRIDGEALYSRLNKNFQQLNPLLKQHGVNIININNDTNLTAFPVKKYQEIFGKDCFRS